MNRGAKSRRNERDREKRRAESDREIRLNKKSQRLDSKSIELREARLVANIKVDSTRRGHATPNYHNATFKVLIRCIALLTLLCYENITNGKHNTCRDY